MCPKKLGNNPSPTPDPPPQPLVPPPPPPVNPLLIPSGPVLGSMAGPLFGTSRDRARGNLRIPLGASARTHLAGLNIPT